MSAAQTRTAVRSVRGTIVFTDLVGFTEFTALRGDEAALALLQIQERLVREETRARGRIVKRLGDGLMLWFKDPCQAVEACLVLQERFEEQSPSLELPLWVRIGVHHGRPAKQGRDLVGHDVNLASRIVDLASPGEVLASEATVHCIGSRLPQVAFEEVGPVVMKGIPSPVLLYRAVRRD